MQLTILADKLPHMSVEEFVHEFRVVHANDTTTMARTLGIISQYIQGLVLSSVNQEKIRNQPMPQPKEPLQSFAQLTWPVVEVMQGSFTTQGYKESAGKHIFATPRKIFLTERLESDVKQIREGAPVRIICVLIPSDSVQENFRKSWDTHADFCRSICPNYQRNQVIPLEPEKLKKIFTDTQFSDAAVLPYGGFEEFVFENNAQAQRVCEQYSEKLASSYRSFTTNDSFCMVFDSVVHYDDVDRGYQQIIAGTFISIILRAKVYFGV